MRYDNPMENRIRRVRQWNGKPNFTSPVQEQGGRKLLYPPFRTPHLFGGVAYSSLVPATPILLYVAGVGELAALVTEDNDVIFENDEKIAELLSIAFAA